MEAHHRSSRCLAAPGRDQAQGAVGARKRATDLPDQAVAAHHQAVLPLERRGGRLLAAVLDPPRDHGPKRDAVAAQRPLDPRQKLAAAPAGCDGVDEQKMGEGGLDASRI